MHEPEQSTPASTPETTTPPPHNPQDERNWGMFCHLAAFAGLLIPAGNIIGPLVVWLLKKDEFASVAMHGKEALNFNITAFIIVLVCTLTLWLILPLIILVAYGIFWLIVTIIAAMKAKDGEAYRYPLTIRFVS